MPAAAPTLVPPAQERLDVQAPGEHCGAREWGGGAYFAVLAVGLADRRVGRFAVHNTFFGLALLVRGSTSCTYARLCRTMRAHRPASFRSCCSSPPHVPPPPSAEATIRSRVTGILHYFLDDNTLADRQKLVLALCS